MASCLPHTRVTRDPTTSSRARGAYAAATRQTRVGGSDRQRTVHQTRGVTYTDARRRCFARRCGVRRSYASPTDGGPPPWYSCSFRYSVRSPMPSSSAARRRLPPVSRSAASIAARSICRHRHPRRDRHDVRRRRHARAARARRVRSSVAAPAPRRQIGRGGASTIALAPARSSSRRRRSSSTCSFSSTQAAHDELELAPLGALALARRTAPTATGHGQRAGADCRASAQVLRQVLRPDLAPRREHDHALDRGCAARARCPATGTRRAAASRRPRCRGKGGRDARRTRRRSGAPGAGCRRAARAAAAGRCRSTLSR